MEILALSMIMGGYFAWFLVRFAVKKIMDDKTHCDDT